MRIRTPAELGRVLSDARRRLGLTQRALAERAGVSRQWIVEVEKGKPRAEVGLLLRTFHELGLVLGTETEAPRPPEIDIDEVVERARGARR